MASQITKNKQDIGCKGMTIDKKWRGVRTLIGQSLTGNPSTRRIYWVPVPR